MRHAHLAVLVRDFLIPRLLWPAVYCVVEVRDTRQKGVGHLSILLVGFGVVRLALTRLLEALFDVLQKVEALVATPQVLLKRIDLLNDAVVDRIDPLLLGFELGNVLVPGTLRPR